MRFRALCAAITVFLLAVGLAPAAVAATSTDRIKLVSVGPDGAQLNRSGEVGSPRSQSISGTGATVTFLRSRSLWAYEERLGYARQLVAGNVIQAEVSADGRWVAYLETDPTAVPDYLTPPTFLRVWDLTTDTTHTLYQSESYEDWDYYETTYAEGTNIGSISADGRFVTYNDARADSRQSGRLWRVDRDADGNGVYDEAGAVSTQAASVAEGRHHDSYWTSMSGDGRNITFSAPVTQQETSGYWYTDCYEWDEEYIECLQPAEPVWITTTSETEVGEQVYVRDMSTGTTTLVSATAAGERANEYSSPLQIAENGTHVLFRSSASDLAGNEGASYGFYVQDLRDGVTTRLTSGPQSLSSMYGMKLTPDGSNVVFTAQTDDPGHPTNAYTTAVGSTTSQLIAVLGESSGGEYDEGLGGVNFSDNGQFVVYATNYLTVVPNFDVASCLVVRENTEEDDDVVRTWDCLNVYRADLRVDAPNDIPVTSAVGVASPTEETTVTTNTTTTLTDPIGASVTVPAGTAGGEVTITEDVIASGDAPPAGYELFGHMVEIHAPAGTAENPLRLSFFVHASAMPEGQSLDEIVIFRNGEPLPKCPDGATTAPQACLLPATFDDATQTYRLDVLTPQASRWTMGYRVAPPVVAAFASPLEQSATTLEINKVKAGRTVPVKVTLTQGEMSLTDADPVTPTVAVSMMSSCDMAAASIPVATVTSRTSSTTDMRWSDDGFWIYNLHTGPLNLKADSCYRVDIFYGSEKATVSGFAVLQGAR